MTANAYFWKDGANNAILTGGTAGRPSLCCRCPCVSCYAYIGFKIMTLTGDNHDTPNWCNASYVTRPVGIALDGHINLDYIISIGMGYLSGVTMQIDPDAGLYSECGRTVYAYEMPPVPAEYYLIIAYMLSPKYECYDDFWAECYGHCSNVQCLETDPVTGDCVQWEDLSGNYVFDGSMRPYYGMYSSSLSSYGCLSYWNSLMISRLMPRYDIDYYQMRLDCLVARDVTYVPPGGGTQMLYAVGLRINDEAVQRFTLIWDGTGDPPDRTTARNVAWLSSGLADALPVIQQRRNAAPSGFAVVSDSHSSQTNVACSTFQLESRCFCTAEWGKAYAKEWRWRCGRIVLSRPTIASQATTGVKLQVTTKITTYQMDTSYTVQTTVSTVDAYWGEPVYLAVADGLTLQASATACDSGDHSPACIVPCPSEISMQYQSIQYSVAAMEYLFDQPSSSSSGV